MQKAFCFLGFFEKHRDRLMLKLSLRIPQKSAHPRIEFDKTKVFIEQEDDIVRFSEDLAITALAFRNGLEREIALKRVTQTSFKRVGIYFSLGQVVVRARLSRFDIDLALALSCEEYERLINTCCSGFSDQAYAVLRS